MIKQHATQSVRDHHLMNELVGYAGLFINLQKGCFPEAKKQIDCAHMNIYRTKGRCQHTFRQWSISLVTQQLGEKQIGPIWWISVALIKGILPFHRRNENLVASLLICRKLDSVEAFADLSTCRDTECLWTAALYNNCLNLKLHCSFLTLYTGTCEVFVIQQLIGIWIIALQNKSFRTLFESKWYSVLPFSGSVHALFSPPENVWQPVQWNRTDTGLL